MNKDLTVGEPTKVLRRFCIPLLGSILFQQLYNIADSFVAGKFVGENALAAVGNSYEITLIFIAFAFGGNIGCSVIVSQLFGAKCYSELKTAVSTTLISCGILCGILMAFGLPFGDRLLCLIHTPPDILQPSALYLRIYILGLPFVFFYNVATGIFYALGDSRTPFVFLMCSSVANIGADILFTTAFSSVFTQGVDGVAWATFLCQGISCVLSLIVVLKRLSGIQAEKTALFSVSVFKRIAAIAIPSTLQQSFISVGNLIIQGAINTFGTGVIAGYAASVKLNNLVVTSFTTLGNGVSNYTAQNIGAEKYDRIFSGYQAGLKLVRLLCVPISVLYFFFGRRLVFCFLNLPSSDALQTGVLFLKIVSPFYFIVSAKLVSDGILRGAGKMRPFMIATFTDLILRVVLSLMLSKTSLGAVGIWIAWPIGWSISAAMSYLFCRRRLGGL